jgi:thiamine kinase-like enzyme
VAAQPFPDDMALRMASTLRTLHSLPNFPKIAGFPHYLDSVDMFVRQFQAANLLSESATGEVFRRYGEITEITPRGDAEPVACHNDLKPQNIRFDGERIWLVDWEAAFLNDRYVDLAIVANFFVKDEAEEEAYLSAYFGEPAGEYQRARFTLMRQVIRTRCSTISAHSSSKTRLPWSVRFRPACKQQPDSSGGGSIT